MTATITPPEGVPFLARTDPQDRLKDYEESLKFYLSLVNESIDAIVFAENSDSDVSTLKAVVSQAGVEDQVEFLVFHGLDYPATYGRAYGEFKLLDYAMKHSQIIASQPAEATIWKVTGRYLVKNLDRIVARQPTNYDVYCNFRKIPTPWADMFLMAWTKLGYQKCLHNIYPNLKSSYETSELHPEEVFISLLEQVDDTVRLAKRLNPAPIVDGVRGSDNAHYLKGENLIKAHLRKVGRVLFPWLWI